MAFDPVDKTIRALEETFPVPGEGQFSVQFGVGDLDGDGDLELLQGLQNTDLTMPGDIRHRVRVWEREGASWTVRAVIDSATRASVFDMPPGGVFADDLDGDGALELLYAGREELAAFERDGSALWVAPTPFPPERMGVADLDDDGALEIWIWARGEDLAVIDARSGGARPSIPGPFDAVQVIPRRRGPAWILADAGGTTDVGRWDGTSFTTITTFSRTSPFGTGWIDVLRTPDGGLGFLHPDLVSWETADGSGSTSFFGFRAEFASGYARLPELTHVPETGELLFVTRQGVLAIEAHPVFGPTP